MDDKLNYGIFRVQGINTLQDIVNICNYSIGKINKNEYKKRNMFYRHIP